MACSVVGLSVNINILSPGSLGLQMSILIILIEIICCYCCSDTISGLNNILLD